MLLSYRGFLPRLFVEAITIELDDPTVDKDADVVVSMGLVRFMLSVPDAMVVATVLVVLSSECVKVLIGVTAVNGGMVTFLSILVVENKIYLKHVQLLVTMVVYNTVSNVDLSKCELAKAVSV